MVNDAILTYLTGQTEAMVQLLGYFTGFDTPALEREAVERLAMAVVQACAERGATVTRCPTGGPVADPVRAVFPGARTDARPILVLGHIDTVWGLDETARRPFRVDGEKVTGPGTYDMKAGLVQALFALEALYQSGRQPGRPVVLLVTTDEEVGSPHSRQLIEQEARRAEAALVVEPTAGSGALKTARKAIGMYRLKVTGKAAHAGVEPQAGCNALVELAHQILYLQSHNNFETGTTVTVGKAAGGTRSNVVPAEAAAEIDIRAVTAVEAQRMDQLLRGLTPRTPGTTLEVTGGINRPPMERGEGTIRLYNLARKIACELGFAVDETLTGGGSDGNFTAYAGCPTLDGLGAVGGGAHALTEHVLIQEMPRRAALLAHLLERL